MPAFNGQFGIPGKQPFGAGAKAWGGGGGKPPAGSNPLPATGSAPADQVYGGGAAGTSPASGGFGGGDASKPTWSGGGQYAAPPQSGHWDMGQEGAAGAWTNGYNPQWETDQRQGPTSSASTVYQQDRAPATSAAPDPYGGMSAGDWLQQHAPTADSSDASWKADPRSNPNNVMGNFIDPVTKKGYSDFLDPSLQVSPGGIPVAANTPGWMNPNADPTAIYTDPSSQFYQPPKQKWTSPDADQALLDYQARGGQ